MNIINNDKSLKSHALSDQHVTSAEGDDGIMVNSKGSTHLDYNS